MGGIRQPRSRDEILAEDELREFHVCWLDVRESDVRAFNQCLTTATGEHAVQAFLQKNPMLLAQCLRGGHGRWVIPQQRLGNQYTTDFILGDADSAGRRWMAVELESPAAPMFNKAGDFSSTVNHAVRQILDWREWLKSNQNMAARPLAENGLGLKHIGPEVPGLILVGRREEHDDVTNGRRRQFEATMQIAIHSYDYLLDQAADAAASCERIRLGGASRK